MVDIDSLTIGEVRRIQALLGGTAPGPGEHPWVLGKSYFVRTVTHHLTGRLVQVTAQELVLVDAAWIADDGQFHAAVRDGEFAEVEPIPDGRPLIVGRGSLIDAQEIPKLPRGVK
jgi:hypothetical protein